MRMQCHTFTARRRYVATARRFDGDTAWDERIAARLAHSLPAPSLQPHSSQYSLFPVCLPAQPPPPP